MKADEHVVAEAVRIEFQDSTGRLFIVFEVKNEKFKKDVLNTWADDIEYRLIDKSLVLDENE